MLEQRQLFNLEGKNNLLFSPVKIDPSISPFLKNRIKIATSNEDYDILINQIKALKIKMEGFKAEYIILNNDLSERAERYKKLRDIGHCIEGFPNFENPTTTYAICKHEGTWYFGTLLKQKKIG